MTAQIDVERVFCVGSTQINFSLEKITINSINKHQRRRRRKLGCGLAKGNSCDDSDNYVMGIFTNVVVVSKMILMLTFILVGAVFLHPYPIFSFCSEGGSGLSYQWWQNAPADGCAIFDSVVYN